MHNFELSFDDFNQAYIQAEGKLDHYVYIIYVPP